MKNPEFLDTELVFDLHAVSLRRFGGAEGVRDRGLVRICVGPAQNAYYSGNGDLYDIAAAYAFHLAQAQAFSMGTNARPLSPH